MKKYTEAEKRILDIIYQAYARGYEEGTADGEAVGSYRGGVGEQELELIANTIYMNDDKLREAAEIVFETLFKNTDAEDLPREVLDRCVLGEPEEW